jgi:hypothetical protein
MFVAVLQKPAQGPISLFLAYTCVARCLAAKAAATSTTVISAINIVLLGGGFGELRDPIAASLSAVAFD